MFCTKCGNKLLENAVFCHMCGAPAAGNVEVPEEGKTEVPAAGNVEVPEEGKTEAPAAGNVEVPEEGKTEVPAEGKPEVHDDVKAGISAEKRKKKGKKGLIIALCAVVAFIGVAVGLMFFFSGKYSDKVKELESYQSSPLIRDMKDEYLCLLESAKESEGVLHVFETFSKGREIDSFFEKVDVSKEELPEEALEALKKLEKLGDKYNVERWGAGISEYGTRIRNLIDDGNYESLVGMIDSCEDLGKKIVSGNEEYKTSLSEVRDQLTDMRTALPAYALYKEEADDYLEQVNETLTQNDYRVIPYYLDKGTKLIETIREANRPYVEVGDRKAYYDGLFADVEMVDTDVCNDILVRYSNALIGGSEASVLSEIVSEYAQLYEQIHEDNTREYLAMRDKIDAFDTDNLSSEEYIAFNDAYGQMRVGETQDKIASALKYARECMAYVDKYTRHITESVRFLDLISVLPALEELFGSYTGEFSEQELYYICEYLLTDEQIDDIRLTLGWGAQDEEVPGWKCGFSRAECEELAYFITGNKHYFYKEISSCASDVEEFGSAGNIGIVGKSDFDVSENDDGTIEIEYDVQLMIDGAIYNACISVTAVFNDDSYFDKYSVADIEFESVTEVYFNNLYQKALNELYDYEPDQYGDDILFSRHMSLVFIDDDYVPELYVNSIYGACCAYLVTYIDNDNYMITALESGDGFSEYIAGEGVIRICDGRMGYYYDRVLEIGKDGSVQELFSGDYYYVDDSDYEEVRYNISHPEEAKDVDMDVYYDQLDENYTSRGESSYLSADFTYEEMAEILSEHESLM
ncbi:MAG: zinc-ribbon domain-containing protein [Lachnospiraceae bacterium]|nr:zinc-ribbon domain-containing protein [Lachnospiraceae bacterium]